MLVAFALRYTWWASVTVVIAYGFLVVTACKLREARAFVPVELGLLMFAPSALIACTIGGVWFRH